MCRRTPATLFANCPAQSLLTALVIGLAAAAAPVLAESGEQLFKILPDDGVPFDYFGSSIALSDGIMAIGAVGNDDRKTDAGAVYLYDALSGEEIDKLYAKDSAVSDFFGFSVAMDAGIVAIGAIWDGDKGLRAGSAYLFDAATGEQLFKLLASDGDEGDEFGYSIAIHDGVVVVGAHLESDRGDYFGAAYLFDASTGKEIAKLVADDRGADDDFGISVAIHDGVVAVGAGQDDDNGVDSGSAYLFDAATGTQFAKLVATDGEPGDLFGFSIGISSGIVAIGAHGNDETAPNAGAAYLFDASNGVQRTKLLADDGAAEDHFGFTVDLDFGLLAVGALWDDDSGFDAGSVYLFDAYVGEQLEKILPRDGESRDYFSNSLSVNDSLVAVSAWEDDDNGLDAGSAYLFDADYTLKCLQLSVNRLLAGTPSIFTVTGGTVGAKAVTVYGLKPGNLALSNYAGYCATFGIEGIDNTKIIGGFNRIFDENGIISFTLFIPIRLPGFNVLFQSAQHNTCPQECVSNLIEAVIQ